jgi:hypothetical protein
VKQQYEEYDRHSQDVMHRRTHSVTGRFSTHRACRAEKSPGARARTSIRHSCREADDRENIPSLESFRTIVLSRSNLATNLFRRKSKRACFVESRYRRIRVVPLESSNDAFTTFHWKNSISRRFGNSDI